MMNRLNIGFYSYKSFHPISKQVAGSLFAPTLSRYSRLFMGGKTTRGITVKRIMQCNVTLACFRENHPLAYTAITQTYPHAFKMLGNPQQRVICIIYNKKTSLLSLQLATHYRQTARCHFFLPTMTLYKKLKPFYKSAFRDPNKCVMPCAQVSLGGPSQRPCGLHINGIPLHAMGGGSSEFTPGTLPRYIEGPLGLVSEPVESQQNEVYTVKQKKTHHESKLHGLILCM